MITPIHILAAVPIKIIFPKHFSLLWFTIVNVLIDIEVLYYIIANEWPIHRFFHSLIGVSIMGFSVFALSLIIDHRKTACLYGCIIGAYSHYIIDGFSHNLWT